jgi:drug/metabolite transporter (DMT)-like permease
MAVPILAILVDYVFINIKFSMFDLLALIFIVTGIYIVAKKPFNQTKKSINSKINNV